VVSLGDVERLRDALKAGGAAASVELDSLLGGYHLGDPETRAAFEAMIESLGRREPRGDAFVVQGVYGAGKSHLVAALALLCGHPEQSWPIFLRTHPEYEGAVLGFRKSRLVLSIALDEYPTHSHPLEHIVLSRLEAELALRHGVEVALSEQSHLLDLVDRYVFPQLSEDLRACAAEGAGDTWEVLRERAPDRAAEVALAVIKRTGFPLDWRRSRAEAWGLLRETLQAREIDGPLLVLDELGIFLAGKDRQGLNADASFLQYLAQGAAGHRQWLVCVTQRGLEEVGDIDRRTVRQLRDRFRRGFTLDLADLPWVVEHRLVHRRDPSTFREAVAGVHADCCALSREAPFSVMELEQSYPINPLCLRAIQRAAETCLSRTRSAVRLLQQAAAERRWLELPANRLLTPDSAFDVFRDELPLSSEGRRYLHAYEVTSANLSSIYPSSASQAALVMKALTFLSLGELRWPVTRLRDALVGCCEPQLWQEEGRLEEILMALYRRGAYVERTRGAGEEADAYYVDVSSDASERIRQRLNEIVAELGAEDSRIPRAAMEACRDSAFPLAGLAEPRRVPVDWEHAQRYVSVVWRDLSDARPMELQNLVGAFESPTVKEDGYLFLGSPTADGARQAEVWRECAAQVRGRFKVGFLAWLPARLSETEREHLVEHAALAHIVSDRTFASRHDTELRAKLHDRWVDSEAEVQRMLPRAYYAGRIVSLEGEAAIEPERLSTLLGDWEDTMRAAFDTAFRTIFPRFPAVAPGRRLVGRTHTNQVIDQFVRPAEVHLPPASALEAYLTAYARPLGLVEGEDRHLCLAMKNRALLQTVIDAVPARSGGDEVDPDETLRYGELAGRLAKSEWGLSREQAELVVAALIRLGHLVALDAFLEPVRFEAVAAPLGDALPYVMRGAALRGEAAEQARCLWEAAVGNAAGEWDLSAQEQAWGEMIGWAQHLLTTAEDRRSAVARAAAATGQGPRDWEWALEALSSCEAVAGAVDASLTSRAGLRKLVDAARRLPGGLKAACEHLATWRDCERFLSTRLDIVAHLYGLVTDGRVRVPEGSLLARERRAVLEAFSSPQRVVANTADVEATANRWLEAYRRHYLAWHARAHAPARMAGYAKLRESGVMAAARRLARAGLLTVEVGAIEAEANRALEQRCLAGDPLPRGAVVCTICGLALGEEPTPADPAALVIRAEEALTRQRDELRAHGELLRRRAAGGGDPQVIEAVEKLLDDSGGSPPQAISEVLSPPVIEWIRKQLGQPKAQRRELNALEAKLRGREVAKKEVMRIVDEWLQAGEDDVVEVV